MRLQSMLLSLVALTITPALAADTEDRIGEIRQLYTEANQLDSGCAGEPCETTVRFERNLPATGPQTTRVTFVYVEHRDSEEQTYPSYHLRRAVVAYNIAAREYAVEYLFEGLQPTLAFHFQADELFERRTYFDGEAPVRIDVRPREPEAGERTIRDGGFTPEELEHCRAIRARADRVSRLFGAVLGTADSEMGGWPDELPLP